MPPTLVSPDLHASIRERADELFHQQEQGIFKSTDRLFAGLMLAQWIAGIFAALYISPLTWQGDQSRTHLHVWAALLLGGIISAFPIWLAIFYAGAAITRYTISAAQMLMSGLLIHLTGGRIETHFHIFGSLAFLAFYRDWRVLIPATIVTCLDHFFRGIYWPESIYGVLTASPWRTLEHVGWVVFEDIFLVVASLRSLREMRSIALHTAQLETTNLIIEERVHERTAEVKASEERFRLLMDGVRDYAIIMLDTEGHVVSWNEGAKRVNGYAAEEILGQHFSRFHLQEDLDQDIPAQQLRDAAKQGRLEEEGWRVRRDGSKFWANVVFTALHDDTKELRGFSKVTRDITVRKQAEETLQRAHDELEHRVAERTAELANANAALQAEISDHQRAEAEIRLQNILLEAQGEAAIEGILVVSAQGQILSYNQRFTEMWDIPKETVAGRSDQEVLRMGLERVADSSAFSTKVNQLSNDHDAKVQDEVLLKNGSIFERYTAPLKGTDGIYYGRIWFFSDVTEARRAAEALSQSKDEAERANAAKSEFLSRMSHELRTPMNAILGFGQLLEIDDLNADQSLYIEQILKGGRHLLGLINEVLEISRIEAGHTSISVEPVSLDVVLHEALDLVRPLAAQRQVQLSDVRRGSRSSIVMADLQRLKQVILNLLSNAIKYNQHAGQVTVESEEREEGRLRLRIRDTGEGIASHNLHRLFVPFDRLGIEHSGIEGNGIGLALSKQLMELMGGDIGVESVVGEGSTFWIELPLGHKTEAHHAQDEILPGHQIEPIYHLSRPTILYIEDNSSNLNLVEGILERHFQCELLSAMQGSLGLQLARQHHPQLILLDLHLPDVMGDEVLQQLKADASTQHIPVIVLSADATERQIQKLREIGAIEYLTKPLDIKQFLAVLRETLAEKTV